MYVCMDGCIDVCMCVYTVCKVVWAYDCIGLLAYVGPPEEWEVQYSLRWYNDMAAGIHLDTSKHQSINDLFTPSLRLCILILFPPRGRRRLHGGLQRNQGRHRGGAVQDREDPGRAGPQGVGAQIHVRGTGGTKGCHEGASPRGVTKGCQQGASPRD